MRIFVLSILFLVLSLSAVSAQQSSAGLTLEVERVAMSTVMSYCVAPIFAGDDVALLAEQDNLPELAPEHANKFLNGGKGRVFAVPNALGYVVLKARDDGICTVIVREMNSANFWMIMDAAFTQNNAPWAFVTEKEMDDGGTTKTYAADINGKKVVAHISARDKAVKNSIQAVITVGNYI
jgi:hypothetical protein